MFDDSTRRAARGEDHALRAICASLFEMLVAFDTTPFHLDRRKWKIAGYRFGKYLASCEDERSKRSASPALVREFSEGLAAFSDESIGLGPPVLFDFGRASELEEKAGKFLALASHASTGDGEKGAAERGLRKMLTEGELVTISRARLEHLEDRLRQVEDVVRFIRARHPGVLLW